ncbi:MAG: hypothetical protein HZA53_04580 [Planctomycetes bacterium]|nr:hypothetical protein [Planctomycetota bacterium]
MKPPLLLGALASACAASGCISGPLHTFRSSAENARTGSDRSRSIANLAELGVHDNLGPGLEYRVDAQVVQGTSDRTTDGVDSHDTTLTARPSAELVLSSDTLRWSQRFETLRTRSTFSLGQDTSLVRNDMLEKLEWTPPGLPQFTTWLNFRTVDDELFVEQTTVESFFQVQQTLPVLDYQYTLLSRVDDDERSGVENDRLEHTLRASWREEAAEGRFTSTVSVFANKRKNELSGSSGGLPGVVVTPTQGLAQRDTTPQISTLPTNAALVDDIDTSTAGINIGGFASGGEEDWNFGAHFNAGSTIDTIHVSTVDTVDSVFASQFVFTVWISDDNAFWTQVGNIAAPDYDVVLHRFRLVVPPITANYVKVVNRTSPPGAPAVLVSELRFFASPTSASPTITTHDETESATTALTYRLNEQWIVGLDLFLQTANTDTSGVDVRDEERIDQGLWANYTPPAKVDANVRFATQRTRDPLVQDEDIATLTSVVAYRPLETLDLNASYTHTDRELDGAQSLETEALQGLTSAQLLDTLRADVTVQKSTQDDTTNQRQIDHWITGASLVAELTAALELTLGWRDDRADVAGTGALDIPDPSERRTEMIWVYKPSDQLVMQLELAWVDNFAGNGLDQRARADWIPFADGVLDVTLDYDHVSVDSSGSSEVDRYRGQMRYTLTPRAFFQLDWSLQDPKDEARTEILAVAFNFSS